MDKPNLVELFRQTIADSENSWIALPHRLRGRGDWLKERHRIKDAELMYDAASEIDQLRQIIQGEANS